MPARDPVRCTFCDDLAVGFGFIQPPMCQRHYEIARMMAILVDTFMNCPHGQIPLPLAVPEPETGLEYEGVS